MLVSLSHVTYCPFWTQGGSIPSALTYRACRLGKTHRHMPLKSLSKNIDSCWPQWIKALPWWCALICLEAAVGGVGRSKQSMRGAKLFIPNSKAWMTYRLLKALAICLLCSGRIKPGWGKFQCIFNCIMATIKMVYFKYKAEFV